MSKTIWKTPINFDTESIKVPRGAQLLTVKMQKRVPTIWHLSDPNEPCASTVPITIYGTGHDMPDDPGTYLGTFMTDGGSFVWHVFHGQPQ